MKRSQGDPHYLDTEPVIGFHRDAANNLRALRANPAQFLLSDDESAAQIRHTRIRYNCDRRRIRHELAKRFRDDALKRRFLSTGVLEGLPKEEFEAFCILFGQWHMANGLVRIERDVADAARLHQWRPCFARIKLLETLLQWIDGGYIATVDRIVAATLDMSRPNAKKLRSHILEAFADAGISLHTAKRLRMQLRQPDNRGNETRSRYQHLRELLPEAIQRLSPSRQEDYEDLSIDPLHSSLCSQSEVLALLLVSFHSFFQPEQKSVSAARYNRFSERRRA
jgi:hypothetical protein